MEASQVNDVLYFLGSWYRFKVFVVLVFTRAHKSMDAHVGERKEGRNE